MAFQISPGVNTSEIDLTTVVPGVSSVDAGFSGAFRWGPINEVTLVDSEDLPLNVSREMLQHNLVVKRIRSALIRRVFSELKKKAEKDPVADESVGEGETVDDNEVKSAVNETTTDKEKSTLDEESD